MFACKECGKLCDRTYVGMCQGCYKYFHSGGKTYPLPNHGVIERTPDGLVICHICGRAYSRLGSHARESHDMTINEYKELFGLCNCSRTTEASYSEKMRRYSLQNGMDKRLVIYGASTRIKVGENDKRFGKKVCL